jgi:hypothetical protein
MTYELANQKFSFDDFEQRIIHKIIPEVGKEAYVLMKALRNPKVHGKKCLLPSYNMKTGLLLHVGNLLHHRRGIDDHSLNNWLQGIVSAMPREKVDIGVIGVVSDYENTNGHWPVETKSKLDFR